MHHLEIHENPSWSVAHLHSVTDINHFHPLGDWLHGCHLDRLDLVICVQSPRIGEKRPVPVSVTLTSKISPFKKIHLEKNPIGFRGRNEIPLLVLEASQVEGRMTEQQRFLFSRQSLCFLVGEKETMKLMIHFWADSLDSLIVCPNPGQILSSRSQPRSQNGD